MGSWNGVIATDTIILLSGTSGSEVFEVTAAAPAKALTRGIFSANVTSFLGAGGGFAGVVVVGAVGGATFVIAGVTGLNANGNYIMGTTASALNLMPRPAYCFVDGFSMSAAIAVGMAGEY